nr:GNAT family N-acetyltransferase [Salsipaludibacter albus]
MRAYPDDRFGPARHMFALACLDGMGPDVARVATDGDRWALCIVHPGATIVPTGDPEVMAVAGPPTRRWRLLIGDVAASLPLLADGACPPDTRVHHQRFMLVDRDLVPPEADLPDPGLRRAVPADADAVTRLAVQLHTDDEFGDRVSRAGRRGYRRRVVSSIEGGLTWVCGPVGAPVAKLDRSVSSTRWGVQLAGIVVEPEARSRGIGRALVAAAVRTALERSGDLPVSLHVRAANTGAIRAYSAAGFVDTEEWRLAVRP